MNIYITVDLEFSAGGAFTGEGSAKPVTERAVYCRVNGVSHGLGFILETLKKYDLRATFFTETAHVFHLGYELMQPVVAEIAGAGHDMQLHIHPMWCPQAAKLPDKGQINDSFSCLDYAHSRRLIEHGVGIFEQWGLSIPVAFRAGNMQIGRENYKALHDCGILISSSIGAAIAPPDEPDMFLGNGMRVFDGVIELPVMSYRDILSRKNLNKCLTVTGVGYGEKRALLERASTADVSDIVLLTHTFEFVKKKDSQFNKLRKNRVNQRRFDLLCAYISDCDTISAGTFSDGLEYWVHQSERQAVELSVPPIASIARILENKLNDTLWLY